MIGNRLMEATSWIPGCPAAVLVLAASLPGETTGVVVETGDQQGWFDAAGPVTTIGFTGFPAGTYVTDQYAKLGVLFIDGNDQVTCCNYSQFPNDGAGLHGSGPIHVVFLSPQRWIAVDGAFRFQLFLEDSFVYESIGLFSDFVGLLSTVPFDEAIIESWHNPGLSGSFDDLLFGGLPVGDLNWDGTVGVPDLLALLAAWGPCPAHCPAICVGDLDGDEALGPPDVLALLAAWGPNPGHVADLDLDGHVGVVDLLTLLGSFGPCPVLFPPTCPPDLDGDCDVGVADLLTMLGNWG